MRAGASLWVMGGGRSSIPMPFPPPLPRPLATAVLAHLDVPRPTPTRAWLDTLVRQYGRHVPWESASRIVRVTTGPREEAPRLPEAFWTGVLTGRTGGTCFESNLALSALLASAGFDGALTINDMGDTRACHTALVLDLADERVVVDVGYPIYAALPLGPTATSRQTPWFRYDVLPIGPDRYRLENHPHPAPYLFDLADHAVPVADYVAALRADYGPSGLFLDRVVIRRIVDGDVWRFSSGDRPWQLTRFRDGRRLARPLPDTVDGAATQVAQHFALDAALVRTALAAACHASGR